MKAGDLKQRIVIQQATKARNAVNELVETWATWATVWAAIEPAYGRMYFESRQLNPEVDGRVRIRYREGLLPTMRINYGGRILKIVSIIHPKEDRREIQIMYKEAL